MRYVKGHGLHTRSRIVEEASYGLRQRGADGLSVVDLMKLAGLTHGGFYAHFESREALVVEAFVLAMDRTIAHWLNLAEELPPEERFDAFRFGLKRRLGLLDPFEILPYRGHGTTRELFLRGRVLEEAGITRAGRDDAVWKNILNMARRFASDEVAGARVRASFEGLQVETTADV